MTRVHLIPQCLCKLARAPQCHDEKADAPGMNTCSMLESKLFKFNRPGHARCMAQQNSLPSILPSTTMLRVPGVPCRLDLPLAAGTCCHAAAWYAFVVANAFSGNLVMHKFTTYKKSSTGIKCFHRIKDLEFQGVPCILHKGHFNFRKFLVFRAFRVFKVLAEPACRGSQTSDVPQLRTAPTAMQQVHRTSRLDPRAQT
jgi:hypothetical protein